MTDSMREPFVLPPLSKQASSQRYFHSRNAAASGRVTVICAGRERCAPDYLVERSGYPCCAIEFVADGSGALVLNGNRHQLYAGVAFTYGPGVPHRIWCDGGRPLTKHFVNFAGLGARELLDQSGLAPGAVKQVADIATIGQLMDIMVHEGSVDDQNASDLCVLYLKAVSMKIGSGMLPMTPAESAACLRYQQCRNYIDMHYIELRDLSMLSKVMGMSTAQICRLFKRFGQEGPYRHLTRCKMGHAAGMLAANRIQVKEVAYEVGYPDPYHFSRLFKQHFGCCPTQFAASYWREG